MDEDGDLDVVYRYGAELYRCLNDGSATFTCTNFQGWNPCDPQGITLADLNCDGHLDVFQSHRTTRTDCPNWVFVGG